jgi:uncharacterized protein (TIGR03083 family)
MDAQASLISVGRSEAEQLTQYLHTLPPAAWEQPSACIDWTVGDVVAHLIMVAELFLYTIPRGLQGDLTPPEGFPAAGTPAAARNAFITQSAIALRQRLGAQLFPTFRTRFASFHQLLTSIGAQEWNTRCYHLLGLLPVRAALNAQVTELAMHGWDIRSRFDPAAHLSAESLAVFMRLIPGFVLPRMAFRPGPRLPAAVRYRWEVTGCIPHTHDVVIEGDACRVEAVEGTVPHATLRCDTETYVLLTYGRYTPEATMASGHLVVEGDAGVVASFRQWFQGP